MTEPQAAQDRDARWGGWPALAVFAAGVLSYATALGNGFVNMDDPRIILGQPFLRALTPANLWTCLSPVPVREEYLPLRDLTYMLDFALAGGRPLSFVLGNLLLHAATAVLVLLLGRRVLARALPAAPAAHVGALALLGALLFAVHPIHAESVAWISGRKDVLSGVLVLLTVLCWLAYLEADPGDARRRRTLYGLTLAGCVLSLASKATAISLPLLLFAADALLFPARGWRARLAAAAPFAVVVGLFALGYTHMLQAFGERSGDFVEKHHPQPVWAAVTFTDAVVFRQYLQRLLVPVGQLLFSEQGYRTSFDLDVGLSLLAVGAALAGTVALVRRWPAAGLLAVWFWATLAPWNLFPHGIPYAERYLYLPSIGFCLLLPLLLYAPLRTPRRVALALGPLLLVCAVQCPRLAAVFESGETLWSHVAAAEPTNAAARMNLANWYAGSDPAQPGVAHDLDRAEALYLEALALRPQKASIHYDLGLLAERRGRLDEALTRYREADHLRARGHLRAVLQAAGVLRKQRRFEAAAALYAAVARRYPHAAAEAAWRTALTWEEAGRPQAAAEALRAFLRLAAGRPAFAARAAEARRRLGEE